MRVDVGVCAFRRLSILETLSSIAGQELPPDTDLRVIAVENDDNPDLRLQIERHAATLGLDLRYVHAPARNISIARNACLDHAEGDVLLFIDDDEVADAGWILPSGRGVAGDQRRRRLRPRLRDLPAHGPRLDAGEQLSFQYPGPEPRRGRDRILQQRAPRPQ